MTFLVIALLFLSTYLFTFGLSMVVKNRELGEAMNRLSENKDFYAAMIPVGALATALGAIFLLLFQGPTNGSGIHSTLVFVAIWMTIIKGLVYMFVPSCYIKSIIKRFSSPKMVRITGVVTAMIGILFIYALINLMGHVARY